MPLVAGKDRPPRLVGIDVGACIELKRTPFQEEAPLVVASGSALLKESDGSQRGRSDFPTP